MKTFSYEFEDKGPNSITYEIPDSPRLYTSVHEGVPFVFANREGMLALAKILIQISLGEKGNTFHLHLRQDFSDEGADVLTVLLDETGSQV
jgi:hypothetical protein